MTLDELQLQVYTRWRLRAFDRRKQGSRTFADAVSWGFFFKNVTFICGFAGFPYFLHGYWVGNNKHVVEYSLDLFPVLTSALLRVKSCFIF